MWSKRRPRPTIAPGRDNSQDMPVRYSVFVCKYQSASPSTPEIRYFWQGNLPPWLPSLPPNHPIHSLVKRPVGHCPETLSEADLTRPQLGPLWPPDNATRIMGGRNGGAVFAAVLDTRSNLLGKWTHLKGFSNINDKSAPPARGWFHLLTETDLIQLDGSQVIVKPVEYRGQTFVECPSAGRVWAGHHLTRQAESTRTAGCQARYLPRRGRSVLFLNL
jgi:hypothetical protein